MVKEKSWDEFRKSGLLWVVNTTLHVFGWSIVMEVVDDVTVRAYPARVKFRGFTENVNNQGYQRVSTYMKENAEQLEKESKE